MGAATAAWISFAPALVGVVVALALDAFGLRRVGVVAVAGGLSASAGAAVWAATLDASSAWKVLGTGGVFSAMCAVVFALTAVIIIGGAGWFAARPHGGSWASLVALVAIASAAAASAADLVTLVIALETAALCSYALVVAGRTRIGEEAAMKYFIQGSVATGLLVMALVPLVGVYAHSGSVAALQKALSDSGTSSAAVFGCVLLAAALAFKAGAVPFHSWAPDAYESAPPVVSAFLATVPKMAAIGALSVASIAFSSEGLAPRFSAVIATLSVASVLVGSVAALGQRGYTRMLGYAGVAQVGYALVALASGFPPAAILFTATYAVGSAATFLAAETFSRLDPEWNGSIAGLAGMGRRAPLASAGVAMSLISLAGVPPLVGFWGKFWAFGAAVSNGYLWLAVIAIVGSIVSVAYYGSVLRALFLEPEHRAEGADSNSTGPADVFAAKKGSPDAVSIAVFVLGVSAVLLGLLPVLIGIGSLLAPFALN